MSNEIILTVGALSSSTKPKDFDSINAKIERLRNEIRCENAKLDKELEKYEKREQTSSLLQRIYKFLNDNQKGKE